MADVIGLHGIHDVTGYKCDLCGDPCDPSCNELNALSCTFANCPVECSVYHQDCLEKYLKSVRLEKNRKTGFKCPRGCGKGSSYSEPCPGKIDKSHPIHIRNDGAKKRKKAPALPPVQPKFVPKEKGKAKEEDAKKGKADKKDAVGAKPKEKEAAKPSLGKLSATPLMKAAAKPTKAELKAAAAVAERDRVAAALHAARKELGLKTDSAAKAAALGSKAGAAGREIQTFEEYEAARGSAAPASSSTAPTLNAWGSKGPSPNTSKPPSPTSSTDQSHHHHHHQQQQPPPVHAATVFPPPSAATQRAATALAPPEQQLQGVWAAKDTSLSRQSSGASGSAAALVQAFTPPPPPPARRASTAGEASAPAHKPSHQASHQAAHAGHHAGSVSSLPPPNLASVPSGHESDSKALPVGMEYAEDGEEGEHRLTKAQRKNLKRAEKAKAKAAQQQGKAQAQRGQHAGGAAPVTGPSEGDSVASSELTSEIALSGILQTEPSDLEQSDLELSDHERCVQILTMHKALYLVAQLQQLGFPEWQCIPAVQHHGSNLEAAVIFLLDGNIASEEDARRTMQSAGMTAPDVDITEELNQLADAKSWLKFPAHIIERAVVEYNGDIDAAISALFERQDQLMPDHGGGLLGHGVAAVHSMGSIAQQAGRAGNGNGNGSASLVGGIATLEVHDRQDAAMNSHHLGTEYNASAPNGYPSVYGNGLSSLTGTGSGHDHFTTAPSGLAASPMGLMSSRTQSNISDLFGSHFGEGEYGAALGRAPSQASLGGNETGSTWSVDSAAGLGLANGLANGVLSSSLGTAASASRQQQAQYFGGQPYASQGVSQASPRAGMQGGAARHSTAPQQAQQLSWPEQAQHTSMAGQHAAGQMQSFSVFGCNGFGSPAAQHPRMQQAAQSNVGGFGGSFGGGATITEIARYNELVGLGALNSPGRRQPATLQQQQQQQQRQLFDQMAAFANQNQQNTRAQQQQQLAEQQRAYSLRTSAAQQGQQLWGTAAVNTSSLWSQLPQHSQDYALLGPDVPEAALIAAAAVTSEPDAPHHNSGGEDQNELDALVAALMCR